MTTDRRHELTRKHEEFKSRLVNDVFGKDTHDKVQMEKVTMLIWQFRDDPGVVQFMAQFVAKFSGSRDVFDGIEFYLPQLAHMIIHLEADWDDAILERFALIIAQQSIHFALQLNWILQGAIEDYQPETAAGEPNPAYNPLFYSRCVKLLSNIERCVVYGTPRTHELQRLYEKGKITKKEYEILEQADRRYNATQISSGRGDDISNLRHFGGELLYKRHVRSACYKPKPWKTRYFSIDERMLNCYNLKGGTLIRAMPLEGAEVLDKTDAKYSHMFEVQNQNFVFRMRAKSEEDKKLWMQILRDESRANALYPHTLTQSAVKPYMAEGEEEPTEEETTSARAQLMHDLTPSQRTRFEFFKNERDFVRSICGVAEELRFKDRSERKKLAPSLMEKLMIPPCAYVPMCNSTDIWRRVDSTIAKDTRVFNTKERCPVIMYFVTKRGEKMNYHRGGMKDSNLDVAEYLHLQFEVPDPKPAGGMEVIGEDDEENGEGGESTNEEGSTELADAELEETEGSAAMLGVWREESKGNVLEAKEGKQNEQEMSKGNRQVQKFLRENVVHLPRKLASRIESRRSIGRQSVLDRATLPLQSVPILESRSGDDGDSVSMDGETVASVGRGSILNASGVILTEEEKDGIDKASLARAKAIICGGETWAEKTARMLQEAAAKSENTDTDGTLTEIESLMAKSNDDLRQEMFVMQMIHFYKSVFANASLPIWLKTYRILSTSKDTGLIEVITDATSIDGLKKSEGYPREGGLRAYFEQVYGSPDSQPFKAAQRNFMQSLVGYSLVSYLLGLKDRHNGNIMIDTHGRVIFIDFGFAMGMAPGHEFSFERAPFKLTEDYMGVMGGEESECFLEFQRLFVAGFEAARANSQIALGLVEIMMYKSNYPCFTGPRYGHGVALKRFEKKLMLDTPDNRIRGKALRLVKRSINHPGTVLYDKFQYHSNGYLP